MPLIPADLFAQKKQDYVSASESQCFYIMKQEFSLLLDSAVSGALLVWTCWTSAVFTSAKNRPNHDIK